MRRDVLVLAYHAVSDDWPWRFSATPAALRAHLERLLERGYVPATFWQAVADPPAARTLAVTFDDGYRSVVERALPVLAELGVPATLFAVADGGSLARAAGEEWLGTPHEPELEAATPAELRRLAAAGWEIGSHTCTHPPLTRLADDELERELRESRDRLEEWLGEECRTLAYPYGDCDARVVDAARKAGYRAAALFPPRFPRPSPLAWPRVGVYREDDDSRFRLKASPLGRRARTWVRGR